jgi:colanic acid/amylovoran biosynthesis glycosyltransferase
MPALGYLVPEFPSQTHAFFWREVQGLRQLGVTVCLLSTSRPPPQACRHDFAPAAAAETDYLFPPGLGTILGLARRPVAALRAIRYVCTLRETPWHRRIVLLGLIPSASRLRAMARRKGFDHVHIHSCASAAHLGAIAHLLGGPTYSLTLHGDLPIYGTDYGPKMLGAAFVSCVTRQLRDQVIAEVGLPPDRVPVLCMGVDLDRFRDPQVRQGSAGVLRAITVARLSWPKGHSFALRALKQAKDKGVHIEYLIVGEGPYRQGIVDEANSLGLADCTRFLGTVSEEDVAKLLAESDVLLLPSIGIGEAAPVSVMEAMACGLPVIASRIGGTPDMIEHEVNGFLCQQEDSVAIAEHLLRLASDLELRRRIGRNARLTAEKEFDSKLLAGRLYEQIGKSTRKTT